mgnify:CR=1 FL=1
MQPFQKAWTLLKQIYTGENTPGFNRVLNAYAEHPFFNHPENTSYRELMEYLQGIKGQKITPEIEDDMYFSAKMAHEHAEHLDGVNQGLHDDDGNPLDEYGNLMSDEKFTELLNAKPSLSRYDEGYEESRGMKQREGQLSGDAVFGKVPIEQRLGVDSSGYPLN